MSVYLITPHQTSKEQQPVGPIEDWLQQILECEDWEIVPGFHEYNGEPAQMIVDTNFLLTEKRLNEEASEILESARGSEAPVFGNAVILTNADRID